MNKRLQALLEAIYEEDVEWQQQNDLEAAKARQSGDGGGTAFDYALHKRLPDTCWASKRWDEAHHWYRHNAQVLLERRTWHQTHSDSEYPLDELTDWEATTLIKAGQLEAGRTHLEYAITYWRQQPDSSLILTELGLHAAQTGQTHLVDAALEIISARQELSVGNGSAAKRIAEGLHYEPAQVALLLGRWDELEDQLSQFSKTERLLQEHPQPIFPEPMQSAILAAGRGLQKLWALKTGDISSSVEQQNAISFFEEAMLYFYQFTESVDWNLYFMRLNTRLVDDIAAGHQFNPNPFANDA